MADLLTFLDLQNRVYRWIDEANTSGSGSPASTTTFNVKDAINASHRRICAKRSWPWMQWPRTESIVTVANVKAYALKPEARKVLTLWDQLRRGYIPIMPRRSWPDNAVDLTATDVTPYGALWGATWPVSVQPTAATVLTLVSTSASDLSVTVQLEGLDTSGDLQVETVAMSGTTPVSSVNTYLFVTGVSKIGTWIGTLSVKYGSTTAVSLGPTTYGKQYPTVEFVESPLSGNTYTYTFERTPRILVNDYDLPHTPYPFSEIHVYDALLDWTTYNTELGQKEQQLWKARYDDLYDQMETASDAEIVGAYPRTVRDIAEGQGSRRILVSN